MKKKDIDAFIEEMESTGDKWTPEQVEEVYGESTLDEALKDRKSSVETFFDIVRKTINNN